MASSNPAIVGLRPNGLEDAPQYELDVEHGASAGAVNLTVADINDMLSSAWGGAYVNDFLDRGRVKRVYLQADAPFRMLPGDLEKWYARNDEGRMVPFSSFATARWTHGSPHLERYNGVRFVDRSCSGAPVPSLTSVRRWRQSSASPASLPPGIDVEWTGLFPTRNG